jgi:hypothetical protein
VYLSHSLSIDTTGNKTVASNHHTYTCLLRSTQITRSATRSIVSDFCGEIEESYLLVCHFYLPKERADTYTHKKTLSVEYPRIADPCPSCTLQLVPVQLGIRVYEPAPLHRHNLLVSRPMRPPNVGHHLTGHPTLSATRVDASLVPPPITLPAFQPIALIPALNHGSISCGPSSR